MTRLNKEQTKERLAEAIKLRGARFTYAAIAEKVGFYDASTCKKALDAYYRDRLRETADVALMMELDTLDQMQKGLYNDYVRGDPKAVTAALKVMDHRAKLLSMYPKEAPQDTSVTIVINPLLLPTQAQQQAVDLGELESVERDG